MSVPLLPPLTRASGFGHHQATPLTEGPAYILGRPSPRWEPRWHRVRSGIRLHGSDDAIWYGWCGPHHYGQHCVAVDVLPEGQPLCGTCEGRATGAVGENGLVFSPSRLEPPKTCPSKLLYVEAGFNVGRCLACGQLAALRASGGPYNPRVIITAHPPLEMVPGCAFHGWRQLVRYGDTAMCGCQVAAQPAETPAHEPAGSNT